MGLFDFFERRQQRESALPSREMEALDEAPGEPGEAAAGPAPEGGAHPEAGAEAPPINVNLGSGPVDVAQIVGMVGRALRTGDLQVSHSESRTIGLEGSGLRAEILEAMRERGIDPSASDGAGVNAADHEGLRERILKALEEHGVDLGEQVTPPQDRPEPPPDRPDHGGGSLG